MNHQLKHFEHLVIKSLLLSLLIHLIIFNTFIFVFPLIYESHKPKFIFLGSILKKRDISISFNKPPTQTNQASKEFTYQKKININGPYHKRAASKPTLEIPIKQNDKKNIKSIFDIPFEEPPPSTDINEKSATQKNIEPYIPFKYYLK